MSSAAVYEPHHNFDRFFEHVLSPHNVVGTNPTTTNGSTSGAVRLFRPRIDLHENSEKNGVTATFELPGVNKEVIQIDVHNGLLTIAAKIKTKTQHDEQGYSEDANLASSPERFSFPRVSR